MLIKEFKKDNLNVSIFNNRKCMGRQAACDARDSINKMLQTRDEINIIFAAAPSQNEFLENLISFKDIEWSRINAFHMDEYLGIDKDAPQGFGSFLYKHLFSKAKFNSVNYLNPAADDVTAECIRYEKLLEDNPVDIVCMGIGENGHIAFNDPPVADFSDRSRVKIVKLDNVCRKQQVNDGCFKDLDSVPKYAITLTIPSLFRAKKLICVVPAKTKANAVYYTLNSEIEEKCPSTIMRLHLCASLYLDIDSAARII
jgi:glucosamine-6-phosphate deaminase